MSLDGALQELARLQKSLSITTPTPMTVKSAYAYPPKRGNALPDLPAWINTWSLTDVEHDVDIRVERYTITCQLFVREADIDRGSAIATAFEAAFITALEQTDETLAGNVIGCVLRGREPTLALLEHNNAAWPGLNMIVDLDIPVVPNVQLDEVKQSLTDWTHNNLAGWQLNVATWTPTDLAPGLIWRYVTLPVPDLDEILDFDHTWMMATVGGRIAAPSSTGRVARARDLSVALTKATLFQIPMVDGSFMCVDRVRAEIDPDPRGRVEVQMDVRFISDQSIPDDGGPFGSAILTWAEDASQGNGSGPAETVTAPVASTRTATPVTASLQ